MRKSLRPPGHVPQSRLLHRLSRNYADRVLTGLMGSRGSWETVRCWSMTVAAARGRAHPVGRTTSGGDMRRGWGVVCALLLTAAATAPARAETTVRWGALSDPETFDPHGPDNLPAWAARRQ